MRRIVLLDANTIWHRRIAEALAEDVEMTIVNPRTGWLPSFNRSVTRGTMMISATLPRGWASRSAFLGQRLLARLIVRNGRREASPPVIALTSPAYAPLAKMLPADYPIVSYTADDYRNYAGWKGVSVVKSERAIYQRSALSIFVSETLRQRAIRDFGLDPDRTAVSPNATEPRFADRECSRPAVLDGRAAPVVGVLGGLSDRLDLEALAGAVSSPAIATFLVAGPASWQVLERYPVFGSAKVVITGRVPHGDMHLLAAAMDVAVIPYAGSELNRHCSPMRLYDHLATGVPIIALEGCDQIDRSAHPGITVVRPEDLAAAIETVIARGLGPRREAPPDCFWQSRARGALAAIEGAVDDHLMPRHARSAREAGLTSGVERA